MDRQDLENDPIARELLGVHMDSLEGELRRTLRRWIDQNYDKDGAAMAVLPALGEFVATALVILTMNLEGPARADALAHWWDVLVGRVEEESQHMAARRRQRGR